MKARCYMILPLVGIIYLLREGATPMRAPMSGIGLCVLVGMIRKETRLNPKKLLDTLESGAAAPWASRWPVRRPASSSGS